MKTRKKITEVEEKQEKPKSNLAITGVYMFRQNIFPAITKVKPGKKGELQITDAIKLLVEDKKKKVLGIVAKGWWDDTGTKEDLLRANRLVLKGIKPEIKGKIMPGVKIK